MKASRVLKGEFGVSSLPRQCLLMWAIELCVCLLLIQMEPESE